MTKPSPKQDQPESVPDGRAIYTSVGLTRRVSVKSMEWADAYVVVRVVQGKVWMSISPPFTWEAMMEPRKVDELMHVLELAREDAKKVAAACNVVRSITSGPAIQ